MTGLCGYQCDCKTPLGYCQLTACIHPEYKFTYTSDRTTVISNHTNTCYHKKVYAPYVLATYPAQHPWICMLCGEKGYDTDQYYSNPYDYYELEQKFKKD